MRVRRLPPELPTPAPPTPPPPAVAGPSQDTGQAPPPPTLTQAPDDPLDALYRTSLRLGPDGAPVVTVRLMDGQRQVSVEALGGPLVARVRPRPGQPAKTVRVPEGQPLTFVPSAPHDPGDVRRYPVVAELRPGDATGLAAARRTWRRRGHRVRSVTVGSIFGLGGRVLDNRRVLVLLDGPGDASWAERASDAVARLTGQAPAIHEVLRRRPTGPVEVLDPNGTPLAVAGALVRLGTEGPGAYLVVKQVEFGVGYKWHGREDRSYTGTVDVVVDPKGLSVVNVLPLETLLRGVVPAETYASAPPAALQAQAITARSEILAEIGTRHLADPALLCAAQHCQVYKGRKAAVASTNAAVEATAGQVLVDDQGHLVNAVYSAVCGGFTENNDVVWAQTPDPVLRGRPDFAPTGKWARYAAGIGTADVKAWIDSSPPAWCKLASIDTKGKFRWTRVIPASDMDADVRRLGVGSVRRIEVLGRGVSGRATAVRITGTTGHAVVRRELPIRRLFGGLNSAMFYVTVQKSSAGVPTAFVFKGGGWGHGVGMCQVGAIGMAEHGFDDLAILRHYYNGAKVVKVY